MHLWLWYTLTCIYMQKHNLKSSTRPLMFSTVLNSVRLVKNSISTFYNDNNCLKLTCTRAIFIRFGTFFNSWQITKKHPNSTFLLQMLEQEVLGSKHRSPDRIFPFPSRVRRYHIRLRRQPSSDTRNRLGWCHKRGRIFRLTNLIKWLSVVRINFVCSRQDKKVLLISSQSQSTPRLKK